MSAFQAQQPIPPGFVGIGVAENAVYDTELRAPASGRPFPTVLRQNVRSPILQGGFILIKLQSWLDSAANACAVYTN